MIFRFQQQIYSKYLADSLFCSWRINVSAGNKFLVFIHLDEFKSPTELNFKRIFCRFKVTPFLFWCTRICILKNENERYIQQQQTSTKHVQRKKSTGPKKESSCRMKRLKLRKNSNYNSNNSNSNSTQRIRQIETVINGNPKRVMCENQCYTQRTLDRHVKYDSLEKKKQMMTRPFKSYRPFANQKKLKRALKND